MNRIFITGAYGMLATDLQSILGKEGKFEVLSLDADKMDITDKKSVEEAITGFKPHYIIHTAAITNVDYCEDNPVDAFRVNGEGTGNVAFYGDKVGAKVLYISSCGLFGDEVREYTEDDRLELKTEYARSKYDGEKKVLDYCSKYFIVRPGWLFGGSKSHKKNFVYGRFLEAQTKPQIQSAVDKYGCPTCTSHLAEKILELLDTDCYGLYHVSNTSYCSRFEYVKKIIESFGLKNEMVPVDSSAFKRSAPVPDCEAIKNSNLVKKGFELLPAWDQAIEEYVEKLKKEI